jgi:hypothetical protein
MSGWRWFWTLVGFLVFILVLVFLYFYKPFEELFRVAIVGLVGYHWRAYRVYIVQQQSVEAMVLASLRGSTFIAILLSAGATLQAVQVLVVHLLQPGYELGAIFGRQVVAVLALVIVTAVFAIIFWLLKVMRGASRAT